MMMKHLRTAIVYTAVTAVGLGIVYPLVITALAHVAMRGQADGEVLVRDGQIAGSALIGQPFTGAGNFHSRPSAAGTGYDTAASSGSNLGPTSKTLVDRVAAGVKTEGDGGRPVPVDLVTASGSGLDPDITPAAAMYQVPRVARERHLDEGRVQELVRANVTPRQLGLLGEPRVNVLRLNLALKDLAGAGK